MSDATRTLREGAAEARAITVRGHQIDSRDLFIGDREILIVHGSECYRLRLTKQNKIILTKWDATRRDATRNILNFSKYGPCFSFPGIDRQDIWFSMSMSSIAFDWQTSGVDKSIVHAADMNFESF
jgi:hemin uptake protein HemP